MMKIIIVIIVVAAGLVGYNYVTTGEISLIPSTLSEEDQAVKVYKNDRCKQHLSLYK